MLMIPKIETLPPPPARRAVVSPEALPMAPSAGTKDSGNAGLPFALAIFTSAFLLFQVQLLLGKEILPLFGGAPAVWTVCVLVFQLLFLVGYGYSHALATRLPLRRQIVIHGALLVT